MNIMQRQRQIDADRDHRAIEDQHNLRQIGAREEFAAWRAANPNFTSRELLDQWRRIRIAWGLSQPKKSRKPK